MNTLFLHFNADGTIKSGAIRTNGKKVPDMTLWEVWEFYQILIIMGYKPIVSYSPFGEKVHIINY